MSVRAGIPALTLAAVLALPFAARGAEGTSDAAAADGFFQAGNWESAAKAYRAIVKENPADGAAWARLGTAHKNLGQYAEAIEAYRNAEGVGFFPPRVRYDLACTHALQGDADAAFEWLDRALEVGFQDVDDLKSNTDLEEIRRDSRFADRLERADRNLRPCEYDAKHRELDFWVGHWKVLDRSGRQVGTNLVLKALNGCMIFENWTSQSGRAGKSMNYYDPEAGKWRQNWVADSGYLIRYEGDLRDGAMHLRGENVSRDGSKEASRMTLTPLKDGSVHQLIEQSRDGGKTWYVWFDGTYVPRFRAPADVPTDG